jgi:hypothetical protein
MASSGGKPKVSPVRRATPIVAVSPGRAPIIIPRRVAHAALKSIVGVVKYLNNASKSHIKPCIKLPPYGIGIRKSLEKSVIITKVDIIETINKRSGFFL